MDMDDGTSLDKRPVGLGKAHLELLVTAYSKLLWCINFAALPNSWKTRKLSSSKIKGYTVSILTTYLTLWCSKLHTSTVLGPSSRASFRKSPKGGWRK